MGSAVQTRQLVQVAVFSTVAAIIGLTVGAVGLYAAFNKAPITIAATDSGRVIPVISMDKPYVTNSRVISFAEECIRRSFAHDFLNFRASMNDASRCYTTEGAKMFVAAMEPLLKEIIEKRMIMSSSVQPPTIVRTSDSGGRYRWRVQARMQLFREGQRERVTPQDFVVEADIYRVDLEEDVRGIQVAGIFVKPFNN